MIDFLNSIIVLLNFIIIPGISYGSQLALGALGVRNATSVPGRLPPPPVSHGW